MFSTTVGRLMIDEALPPDMRGRASPLDKKGVQSLFRELAERYPDKYREVAHKLMQIGARAGYASGGYSFGLRHIMAAKSAMPFRAKLEAQVERILDRADLSEAQKQQEIVLATGRIREDMEKAILKESEAENNPLVGQIAAGKGNPTTLRSIRGGDLLYQDPHEREVPIPVLRGYSEGLRPAEYIAGSFGARKGVVDLKLATSDSGYASKQLAQLAHRLLVTAHDSEKIHDPLQPRGLPVRADDPDNEGAFLAAPAGTFGRNTRITPDVIAALKKRGIEHILVRSPAVGGPEDGGIYALDAGVRERGRIAPLHDNVGLSAAQALGEPISQGAISSKHKGGVAGTQTSIGGFKLIDQLLQTPSTFPGGATHAQIDGRIDKVEEAPQGGHYVTIEGQKHYVAQGNDVTVKPGARVEAGDELSTGISNPAELTFHKGIGEGRRRYIQQFAQAVRDADMPVNRRNVELIARGLIDHVQLHEEVGEHDPDDIIPYSTFEHSYRPRKNAIKTLPEQAMGKYLEQPVLHYSIGTRVRPSVVKELNRFGVKHVMAHDEPPPFTPVMVSARTVLQHDPDWQTRMLGSYLEKNLLKGVHRADVSDPTGTSFVPALAKGLGFGTYGKVKGWDIKEGK